MADKLKASTHRTFAICKADSETDEEALARTFLRPEFNAAVTMGQFASSAFAGMSLEDLVAVLEKQSEQASSGDLRQCEATLAAQVTTLDAVFNQLVRRSFLNMGKHFSAAELLMKLALRAQGQCRVTIEALTAMKQPPSGVIRQTNIAHGHQQVNNFPAEEIEPNKLLDEGNGERMDP